MSASRILATRSAADIEADVRRQATDVEQLRPVDSLDDEQVHAFRGMMQSGRLSAGLIKPVAHLPSPDNALPDARVRPAGKLSDLSDYLHHKQVKFVGMVGAVLNSRDTTAINKTVATMVDNGVENDLMAKTIGKTVSAVDQLTKLN